MILKEGETALWSAVEVLKRGGVIVYPTDTVYGIGGDATRSDVVERIMKIKRISRPRPFSIMLSFEMIDEYCETGIWEDLLIKKYLPGPYTFIVKKSRNAPLPASPFSTIGIRIPDNDFCLRLVSLFKRPIISTSANISGKEPPVSFDEIDPVILENVDLAVDGGSTKYSSPSVVVDLIEKKIRRGGVSIDMLDL